MGKTRWLEDPSVPTRWGRWDGAGVVVSQPQRDAACRDGLFCEINVAACRRKSLSLMSESKTMNGLKSEEGLDCSLLYYMNNGNYCSCP